jgi:hypothetical protein
LSCLEGLDHSDIYSRTTFKSVAALRKLCMMLGNSEATERIDLMDIKVATVADLVKYAVL